MEQGPWAEFPFLFFFFFFNISGCRKPRQAKSKLGQTPAPTTWPLTKTHDAWHRPGPCNQTRSPNPGLHHPRVTIQKHWSRQPWTPGCFPPSGLQAWHGSRCTVWSPRARRLQKPVGGEAGFVLKVATQDPGLSSPGRQPSQWTEVPR